MASYVKAGNYDNAALAAEKVFPQIKDEIATSDKYVIGLIQYENTTTAEQRTLVSKIRFWNWQKSTWAKKWKVKSLLPVSGLIQAMRI